MLKNIIYQLLSFLYFISGMGQTMPLDTIGPLPGELEECSGMALLPSGKMIMINDSGNEPILFFTDSVGRIFKSTRLDFATNTDWEEIVFADGYLYIGDFGNNRNDRTDLKVYKVGLNEDFSVYDAGVISFNYAEQDDFPPGSKFLNFDLEAMVHYGDSLYLFSKNRTEPFDGYTYLYALSDKPGDYTISRTDSFKTGNGMMASFWIAGAALSPGMDKLVLLSYDKMWLFTSFSGSRFFSGKSREIAFHTMSQKEAVVFEDESDILISDETNPNSGGKLYRARLESFREHVTVSPEEFSNFVEIQIHSPASGKILWEIFTTGGERILYGNQKAGKKSFKINTSTLTHGHYVISVIVEGKPHAFTLRKPLETKNSLKN